MPVNVREKNVINAFCQTILFMILVKTFSCMDSTIVHILLHIMQCHLLSLLNI